MKMLSAAVVVRTLRVDSATADQIQFTLFYSKKSNEQY